MLPTTPLHHLLLKELDFPVIATSGNHSDEPIAMDEAEACQRLGEIADVFLVHNRPIARRVDDSVIRMIADKPIVLRLARGYAPLVLPALEEWTREHLPAEAPTILAVGGQQKVALALFTGEQAVLGPHLGDLDTPLAREAFIEATRDLPALYGCQAEQVACDLHPDYASTRWAEETGLPVVRVQHHHAHAVACMVEHGLLAREVLAFTWDGTGLGTDGTIWGGEVLRARMDQFERVASLRPFVLPGGEAAIREPARVALALLAQALGPEAVLSDQELPGLLGMTTSTVRRLLRLIERQVNCPITTSMGRLFDAVAVIALGATHVSHAGEAAAWLEAAASEKCDEAYTLPLVWEDRMTRGDWRPLLRSVWADRKRGIAAWMIASRFHEAVIGWGEVVAELHSPLPIVLGGGCFQNRRLVEGLVARLRGNGRKVYVAATVPPGDGGLAAGQLAVALASCISNKQAEVVNVPGSAGTACRAAAGC